MNYACKPLEFAKGKNTIELASETKVADTLRKLREAAEPSYPHKATGNGD